MLEELRGTARNWRVLTVARLYIEPLSTEVKSGPDSDPVASDAMHLRRATSWVALRVRKATTLPDYSGGCFFLVDACSSCLGQGKLSATCNCP